jgi:hypothetical protein
MSAPMPQVVTILGEVAAVISAAAEVEGRLPLPVTVITARLPMAELADLDPSLPVRVTVVPHLPDGRAISQEARGTAEDQIEIDIGIQRRIGNTDGQPTDADIDALLALSETIANLFKPGRLPLSGASWVRTVHTVLFDPTHLIQHSTFTGVITVTFAVFRST